MALTIAVYPDSELIQHEGAASPAGGALKAPPETRLLDHREAIVSTNGPSEGVVRTAQQGNPCSVGTPALRQQRRQDQLHHHRSAAGVLSNKIALTMTRIAEFNAGSVSKNTAYVPAPFDPLPPLAPATTIQLSRPGKAVPPVVTERQLRRAKQLADLRSTHQRGKGQVAGLVAVEQQCVNETHQVIQVAAQYEFQCEEIRRSAWSLPRDILRAESNFIPNTVVECVEPASIVPTGEPSPMGHPHISYVMCQGKKYVQKKTPDDPYDEVHFLNGLDMTAKVRGCPAVVQIEKCVKNCHGVVQCYLMPRYNHTVQDYWCLRHHTHESRMALIRAMIDCLKCLHAHGIIHRDIKGNNMVVTDDGRVLAIDLDAASCANSIGRVIPEELMQGTYGMVRFPRDEGADWYALLVSVEYYMLGNEWPANSWSKDAMIRHLEAMCR